MGCREVVDDGVNGYPCQVREAKDLAAKIEQMLHLSPAQRTAMGLRGRAKMETEFDEQIVIRKYLEAIIAGIAMSRRASLATRNTKHFDDLTTSVINPWAD